MIATIELGPRELALTALLLLLNAGVAALLRLGLGQKILVASLRAVLQLGLLGLVLTWVFRSEQPVVVLGLMTGMAVLAGFEAVRRIRYRVRGLVPLSLAVVLSSSMLITLYATQVVLQVEPWYEPRYLVPILGMILGNALNGVSLGLETSLSSFRRDRERVEMLLAHGATPREASRDVVREAVRVGMIPILNSMVAAGVISIPGMMTGQILAGEDPSAAAGYQVFVLFAIAAGVALGTLGVVLGSVRLVFDDRMRLRADWIDAA